MCLLCKTLNSDLRPLCKNARWVHPYLQSHQGDGGRKIMGARLGYLVSSSLW